MIDKSIKKLEDRNISIEIDDSLVEYIFKVGFDENYGARPLRRAVQSKIEDKFAEEILDGKVKNNNSYILKVENDEIIIKEK